MNYQESCREFCPLAAVCRRQALAVADPIILGARARETLASITLTRALELRDRRGAPPANPLEQAWAERIRAADAAYQNVV